MAVGAYAYDSPEANEGKVFVWYGSATGLGTNGTPANADWEAESNSTGSIFGYSVAAGGDVNDDGYDDLLVTAPSYPIGGAWFLWTGSADGLGPSGSPLNCTDSGYSDQSGSNLGRDTAGALDANGDGRDDIFVAARLYSNGQSYEGMVFGYYSFAHQYLPLIIRQP